MAAAVKPCPVDDPRFDDNVPCPRLVSAMLSVPGWAPCAKAWLTWLDDACAIGCDVALMVTAMVLLSPTKTETVDGTAPPTCASAAIVCGASVAFGPVMGMPAWFDTPP